MLKITLLCVGKLKEKFYIDAAEEYYKRLSGFYKLEVVEIPEYRLPADPSYAQILNGLNKEHDLMLTKLPREAMTAALCIDGDEMSSSELSEFISQCPIKGISKLCFIIGGSYGLHASIIESADIKLSLSKMTLPHHLARIVLLEQLYRGFKIAEGGRYVK